jgi:hypothetical protein
MAASAFANHERIVDWNSLGLDSLRFGVARKKHGGTEREQKRYARQLPVTPHPYIPSF